jgi:hypothetical protein
MNEIERVARMIAAEKMMLVKDPEGLKLPDDLWKQAVPQALAECEANHGPEDRPDLSH